MALYYMLYILPCQKYDVGTLYLILSSTVFCEMNSSSLLLLLLSSSFPKRSQFFNPPPSFLISFCSFYLRVFSRRSLSDYHLSEMFVIFSSRSLHHLHRYLLLAKRVCTLQHNYVLSEFYFFYQFHLLIFSMMLRNIL